MRNMRRSIDVSRRADMLVAAPWTTLEKLLLAAICTATLFFVFITPPFQSPDENQHYYKALLLSEGRILTERSGDHVGAHLPRAAVDLHMADFPTDVGDQYRRFDVAMLSASAQADASRPGRRFANFPNASGYPPTLYMPGAAGLLVGEGLGLSRLGALYLGRLVNGMTALAMLVAALRLLPFGRMAMIGTALLPTFSYQIGSLSPDAVIFGTSFLGLALALRIAFMGASPARASALLLTAPLIALAKGVYLPLLAAGLRWPLRGTLRRSGLITAAMIVAALFFLLWMPMSGGTETLYTITSRKTGQSVMTAPLADQIAVIVQSPLGYIHILFSSIVERTPVYLLQIVGRFGWNAILLPLLAYPLAALMLAAAVSSGANARFGFAQRLWWLAIVAGIALLIETAMYLTGTPLAADYIQGTQGRYFLPILPLALMAFMPARPLRGARRLCAVAGLALLAIALASAVDSFWVHGFVTADGMPPSDGMTGTLLLPSPRW